MIIEPFREDKDARIKTSDEIKRRVNSDQPWGQFIIFPEGTTSNRSVLVSFFNSFHE